MNLESLMGMFLLFYLWIIYKFWCIVFKTNKKKKNISYFKSQNITLRKEDKKKYIDINKAKLLEFNTEDLEAFKEKFYNIFLAFEEAYNNLDYSKMKMLTTNQIYHNYYTGISLDLETGNKKIISNIEKNDIIIYEVFTSVTKQVVSALIEINYYNYTVNKNGTIISGYGDKKITEKFEVTFRKDFNMEKIVKCPNCGAQIVGNKCEYCRVDVNMSEFRISSIKKVTNQK